MTDASVSSPALTEADSRLSKRKLSEAILSLDAALKSSGGRVKKRKTSSPHRISTPALEAILAKSHTRASKPTSAPPPPSYEPNSLPALLSRLSTYRLATFSPSKPPSLSSLACTLHGWKHTSSIRERVQCVTCGRGVVLLPPSSGDGGWSNPAGQKLRAEYERLVLDDGKGHAETCPWRLRPCARSLYRLLGGGLGVQAGGRRRLIEDVVRAARDLDDAGLGEMVLELPDEASSLVESRDGKSRLAKALSSVSAPSSANDAAAAPPATPSTSSALLAIFEPKPFNLVKQHQPFCPFIDPYAGHSIAHDQSATPKPAQLPPSTRQLPPPTPQLKPGWQVRLETILPRHAPPQSAGFGSTTNIVGAEEDLEAVGGGQGAGLLMAGKTKELLSYVRSLLGPKTRTSGISGGPRPSQLL
ncbi:hypothetical protein JCM10295v2_006735 [Rhodotorula toruloides]